MPDSQVQEPSEPFQPLDSVACYEAMEAGFAGYLIQRDIVLRKLQHAQTATECSLLEVSRLEKKAPESCKNGSQELKELREYDVLWTNIIGSFKKCFLSCTDLKTIEDILASLPQRIMKFYEALVSKDSTLRKLVIELTKEKYIKAQQAIETTQRKFCSVMGISTEDIDLPSPAEIVKPAERDVRVFIFRPIEKKEYPEESSS